VKSKKKLYDHHLLSSAILHVCDLCQSDDGGGSGEPDSVSQDMGPSASGEGSGVATPGAEERKKKKKEKVGPYRLVHTGVADHVSIFICWFVLLLGCLCKINVVDWTVHRKREKASTKGRREQTLFIMQ